MATDSEPAASWEDEAAQPAQEEAAIRSASRAIQDAANRFVAWLQGPRLDASSVAVDVNRTLGRWVEGYFRRNGVPDHEAEELVNDVWVRLFRGNFEDKGNGFALVCRVRRSVFIDYVRARRAGKRTGGTIKGDGGAAEVQGDDELWDALANSVEAPAPPDGLEDCVQRKFHIFRSVAPARAELLGMITMGMSYKEIGAALFNVPEHKVDAQQVARVRNRIEEARKQAEPYFRECED